MSHPGHGVRAPGMKATAQSSQNLRQGPLRQPAPQGAMGGARMAGCQFLPRVWVRMGDGDKLAHWLVM